MATSKIKTVEQLHEYLHAAMQLEHATIPPYLTAMYTIVPGTNADAYHMLRVTVVEEMLHLTLAANLLNAVGGTPDLTAPDFVPDYPAYLPDGERDFTVSRRGFGEVCIRSFMEIERPRKAHSEDARLVRRSGGRRRLGTAPGEPEWQFYSIGEFYHEIAVGLHTLHEQLGDDLFCGDPARQVSGEYFYSGGGTITPVTDLPSARKAINLISEQGEGLGGKIFDAEHELAHYYRFEQLTLGRYYLAGDEPGAPSGPPCSVDWSAGYPIKTDAHLADYAPGSELLDGAVAFNQAYFEFLELLTKAFTGQPHLLHDAVPGMFRLRDLMLQLIHHPIPGEDGVNAAPTFEMPVVARAGDR